VKLPRGGDHVVLLVALGKPGSQEHTSHVHIERDVAPRHLVDRDASLTLEDLHGHRGLLRPDALEPFLSRRVVIPDALSVATVFVEHAPGGQHDP
jgi:hypothetical protein